MREARDPRFAPPVEEGAIYTFQDEAGELTDLEFLGLILHNDRRYGFFFPIGDEGVSTEPGEVVVLEVTALDAEGQPESFELVLDEAIAAEVYDIFRQATNGMYDFS